MFYRVEILYIIILYGDLGFTRYAVSHGCVNFMLRHRLEIGYAYNPKTVISFQFCCF